jgi:DNA-binding CsgD family transcriptional regulator
MVFNFFKKKSDPHKRLDDLHFHLGDSFTKIKKDIVNLGNWITHFDSKTKNHEDKLNYVLRKLELLENLLQEKEDVVENEEKVEKKEETIERIQSFNRSNQSIMNVQSLKNLTPAQKQILALMSYAGGPLGYDDMSKKLGLNIVTVRRHLNDIKRSGIKVEEKVSVRGRKKVFLLDKKVKNVVLKQRKK